VADKLGTMGSEFDVPSTESLDAMYESLKNWGRWGADDQRGALNHLTAEHRAAAAALVRSGESISLAHNLGTEPSSENPHPVHHHMLASGDARETPGIPGYEAARDHIALDIHGLFTTHVDALSHMFVRGQMFGGRPASDVRSDGARSNTVLSMADGVVGRGVLLDVPRALGLDFLDTGQVVTVEDLRTAERAQDLRVGSGDILLVSWGRAARKKAKRTFDGFSGLHADCLPWLHERQVAVLGSDGISDPMPFVGTPGWPFPVHQIGITAMGLHLIDNMSLARLSDRCAAAERWAFLFTMGPLRIAKGTGCPVNPIAVL
jgi:kynurenine formamidase